MFFQTTPFTVHSTGNSSRIQSTKPCASITILNRSFAWCELLLQTSWDKTILGAGFLLHCMFLELKVNNLFTISTFYPNGIHYLKHTEDVPRITYFREKTVALPHEPKIYTGCFMTSGLTAGGDFLGLCDQKSSYKHVSDFGRLRSYDRL